MAGESRVLTWLKSRGSRQMIIFLIGVMAIPGLYGGLLLWSNEDPVHRLASVPALIVNEDQPVTSTTPVTSLGEDLTNQLLTSTDGNFTWSTTDMADAMAQLQSGKALVMLHIPSSFSANVVSLGGDDPAAAATAELTITTNDSSNMIMATVAKTVGQAINDSVATKVRQSYLEGVYSGLATIHTSMASAADAAAALRDASTTAASGAADLHNGLSVLSSGATSLSSGVDQITSAASLLSDGACTLRDGLDTLNATVAGLSPQIASLLTGAQQANTGAATAAGAAQQIASGAAQADQGASVALAGATTLRDTLSAFALGSQTLDTSAAALSTGLAGLFNNYDSMTDDQRKALIAQLASASGDLADNAAIATATVAQLLSGANQLVGDAASQTGLAGLSIATGLVDVGASTLSDNLADLAAGMSTLNDGVSTLGSNMPQLTGAVGALDTGASTLADSAKQLAAGASQLASGTSKVAQGAFEASLSSDTLAQGLDELSDGIGQLSDALNDGASSVPDYSTSQADHLATSAAAGVSLTTVRLNEVPTYGYGLTGYFAAIALWVGAVAFYFVFDVVSKKRIAAGQSAARVAFGSIWPGFIASAVQSAVLLWVIVGWLGIHPANLGLFTLVLGLSGITFFAVNQALLSLLGMPGRFISLMLLVLQVASAGGMYPVQTMPHFLQVVHQWVPVSYTVTAIRSLVSGGTVGLGSVVPALGTWLVIGIAGVVLASWLQVRRSRNQMDDEVVSDA